ncbi:MAG: hypothetical protein R2867_23110 [Caldilineaceae bacterium]
MNIAFCCQPESPNCRPGMTVWPNVSCAAYCRQVEPFLEVGRFHSLLPPAVADEVVIALCDTPRFERLYCAAQIVTPSAPLRAQLTRLLG